MAQFESNKSQNCTKDWFWLVLLIFIPVGWVVIYIISSGKIDGESLFGICGFRQKYDLPCPFCGMTSSAVLFSKGYFVRSFTTQPAGFALCLLSVVSWIISIMIFLPKTTQIARRFLSNVGLFAVLFCIFVIIVASWLWKIYEETYLYE